MFVAPITRPEFDGAFESTRALIAADSFLRPSIIDLQEYEETLVAFIDANLPKSYVETRLRSVWPGDVEVYNGTNLMVGC